MLVKNDNAHTKFIFISTFFHVMFCIISFKKKICFQYVIPGVHLTNSGNIPAQENTEIALFSSAVDSTVEINL